MLMRKIVSFVHVSLDGFVAAPNGGLDWIIVNEEIFEYVEQRIRETDTALYGRVTYQMMENYWPAAADQPSATRHDIEHSRWYKNVTKIVLSRTMNGENLPNTKIIGSNLMDAITKLKQGAGSDILLFGSPTATHSLIAENLIDEYWLFLNPILLGQGVPLFKGIKSRASLKLVTSKAFSSGVVCLQYEYNREN
jgi:dihydrofolate reductase